MKHAYHTVFGLAIFALLLSGCTSKKSTSSAKPGRESGEVEPEQLKPEIDTRFQEKFFQAQLEKSKGNPKLAYELFVECLQIEKNNAAVHYELGRMDLMLLSDPNSALVHAKVCAEQDKNNPWYQLLLADAYAAMAKFDLAIKSYKEVARLNPDDPEVLYKLANTQLYAGKINDAIATYDELELKTGPYEDLTLQKHQLYLQMKDVTKAGLELEKLATAFPEEPRYWGMAAQFYQSAGMEDKVKFALDEMVKYDPDNGQVHYQLSEYYAARGEDKRSYEELKKAFATTDVAFDQKLVVMLRYLTLTEIKPEYLPQAYELLEMTEELHPKEAMVYSLYGDFLFRENKSKEALDKFRKSAELNPSNNLTWERMLLIASELSDYNTMAKDSEQAISLFPTLPDFYYYNGMANERLKEYQKAVASYQLGKELVIDNPALMVSFYSGLGESLHYLGQHDKSDEAYEEALRIDASNVFVLNNYAYYLSLRKVKLEKAAGMSGRANELQPGVSSFEDTYAWILFHQGKYNEALEWIKKALNHGEVNGELLEHEGDILFKLGRVTEAVEKWKAAQHMGGTSEQLPQKIEQQKFLD